MGGGGQSGSSKSTTEVIVPPEVRALMGSVVPDVQTAFQLGDFPSFMQPSPFAAPSDQTLSIINSIVGGVGQLPDALMSLLGLGGPVSTTTGLTPGQSVAQSGFASLIPSITAGSAPSRDVITKLLGISPGTGSAQDFARVNFPNYTGGWETLPQYLKDESIKMTGGGGGATSGPIDTLNRALALATGQLNAPLMSPSEASSVNYLSSVLSAPIGSSPATLEAIKNWQNTALPVINNSARLSGYGQSAALPAAVGQSMSALLAPLYGTEIADRSNAASTLLTEGQVLDARPGARASTAANLGTAAAALPAGLAQMLEQINRADVGSAAELLTRVAGLGGAQLSQPLNALNALLGAGQTALNVSGIPQQAAQQDYLRRQALLEQISNVVTGAIVPSTFGQAGRGGFENRGGGLLYGMLTGGSK